MTTMRNTLRKAFTLMEVNIAIFVMSVGILSMVSLYSLGYREQSQSREDVEAAVMAERFMAPLVAMLSSPELKWSAFNQIESFPEDGWAGYIREKDRNTNSDKIVIPRVKSDATNIARQAFDKIANTCKTSSYSFSCPSINTSKNPPDPHVALVIAHEKDSPIVSLSLRSGKRVSALLSQPLYYTEVHFQGDPNL